MPTPFSIARRLVRSIKFGTRSEAGAFQHIFDTRYWGDGESVSGIGSSLAQTESVRRELPRIVKQYNIKSMIDAPCGDLYWMSKILEEMDIDYIGGDIVPEVVDLARAQNEWSKASFIEFDITQSAFPDCDMWLCRDVLFHLSFKSIRKALENFKASNIEYLLVTSHTGPDVPNRSIVTGDFRLLDLFKGPLNFPKDKVIDRFPDFAPPHPPRDMLMFRREDLLGVELVDA